MPTLLILKGLPASGKSTYAKQLVDRGNWKRINKDDLRAMLDNSNWSEANEKFILNIRDMIIVEALSAGKNIVIDDTNLAPKHETDIRQLVESFHPDIEVKFFECTPEICIERDSKRSVSVGANVIWGMYNQYIGEHHE